MLGNLNAKAEYKYPTIWEKLGWSIRTAKVLYRRIYFRTFLLHKEYAFQVLQAFMANQKLKYNLNACVPLQTVYKKNAFWRKLAMWGTFAQRSVSRRLLIAQCGIQRRSYGINCKLSNASSLCRNKIKKYHSNFICSIVLYSKLKICVGHSFSSNIRKRQHLSNCNSQ